VNGDAAPESARTLNGVLLATLNDDHAGVHVLVDDLPRRSLVGLIAGLAQVAVDAWVDAGQLDPDELRRVLRLSALEAAGG
jgi:hypothetical protein